MRSFNSIDLPPYKSYHEMKEKLRLAIEDAEGFEEISAEGDSDLGYFPEETELHKKMSQ